MCQKVVQSFWKLNFIRIIELVENFYQGHFSNPLLVFEKWALFFVCSYASQFKSNQQNQPFEQKSAFWWVCSTVLNKCGHTYIVSYYHNNSLYGTHTKTQKRIPLSLKHNFPTNNGTKLFHKSFLKSCVSMISHNFYSKNLGSLEYFRKEKLSGSGTLLEFFKYRKVTSSSLSRLVAHFWIFRLFMKGNFDAYVLWPLAKRVKNWIVDRSTACDFTVFKCCLLVWHNSDWRR